VCAAPAPGGGGPAPAAVARPALARVSPGTDAGTWTAYTDIRRNDIGVTPGGRSGSGRLGGPAAGAAAPSAIRIMMPAELPASAATGPLAAAMFRLYAARHPAASTFPT